MPEHQRRVVLDSCAWIEFFSGTPKGKRIQEQLKGAIWFASAFAVTEACSWARQRGEDDELLFQAILNKAILIHLDGEVGFNAARFHALARKKKPKFSFADAVTLASADWLGAELITCDNDFAGMKNVTVIR